jgi:hypothetical protein
MSCASGSHTVFHHRYYIVLITKYCYKVLEGALRERIRAIIRRGFVARTCPYVRGNPAAYCRQRLRAARQGPLIPSVCGMPQRVR